MNRQQGAAQLKEQAIQFNMRFGHSREMCESCFNEVVERYKKEYKAIDEYSPIIRAANETLYGCGMLDRILTENEIDFLMS